MFTPSDGVQQAIEWLNENADHGQVAQLYLHPKHIVGFIAPNPQYIMSNGFNDSLLSKPDYVVVHINGLIWHGFGLDTPEGDIIRYPFDQEILKQDYKKVFSIERAFDIEIVSIWQRN